MEIFHVMHAFVSFANDAQERSRSTSGASKYRTHVKNGPSIFREPPFHGTTQSICVFLESQSPLLARKAVMFDGSTVLPCYSIRRAETLVVCVSPMTCDSVPDPCIGTSPRSK